MLWLYGNCFITFWFLQTSFGKITNAPGLEEDRGGLSNVSTKLELSRSESNETLEINVLQRISPRALNIPKVKNTEKLDLVYKLPHPGED